MINNLTEKQSEVLDFIEEYQMHNGKSPTIREMRENFGLSSDNSIVKHLKALMEKGYIKKDDTPRGIKLLESVKAKLMQNVNMFKLPILGFIPAGGPVSSEASVEGYMNISEELVKNSTDYFLLTVKGDSMIDAGIFEGDLVLVDMKKRPRHHDIVVGLVDNENTLKRLIMEGNNMYLKAENKAYSNIYPINELSVQGVIISLIRQY